MKKPLIGITLDSEESGDYSKFPWYAMRQNYLDSIYEYGGIPFPLFHNIQSISELSDKLDGLIITGGNFDISPELYNKNILGSRIIKSKRTEFEICIFENVWMYRYVCTHPHSVTLTRACTLHNRCLYIHHDV